MGKITNQLLDHDFDGIQEYDNDLPGWWKALFLITIIIAVIYVPYYHFVGDLQDVEYQKEMGTYAEAGMGRGSFTAYSSPYAKNNEMTPALRAELDKILDTSFEDQLMRAMGKANADQLAKLESAFPDVYIAYTSGGASAPAPTAPEGTGTAEQPALAAMVPLTDEANLEAGKKVWDTQCFACHLFDGGGSIGPNMTDKYWIHGPKMEDITNIIKTGVIAKGMVPWEGVLTPDEIMQVSSYIKVKLAGSTPAVGKAPQGDLYED